MEVVQQLIELFPYAILGSIAAGIICGFLGVFVVSQRVVFLGASLTQVSIAGVAFSFLHLINFDAFFTSVLGINMEDHKWMHHFEPTFFSLLFAVIAIFIFTQSHRQKNLTQDAVLGILFIIAIAARIMFIQKSDLAEVSEIESILRGDILFIAEKEFYALSGILVITFLIFFLFRKQLKFVAFDPDSASAHGINSKFWLLVFYLAVGIGISVTTRFVGDVFTFAYLLIPSSIGILISKKVNNVFLIAMTVGGVVPPVSLYFAFVFDFSSGPTAVVLAFILLMLTYGIKKIKGA